MDIRDDIKKKFPQTVPDYQELVEKYEILNWKERRVIRAYYQKKKDGIPSALVYISVVITLFSCLLDAIYGSDIAKATKDEDIKVMVELIKSFSTIKWFCLLLILILVAWMGRYMQKASLHISVLDDIELDIQRRRAQRQSARKRFK
jgi:hypothetical protein